MLALLPSYGTPPSRLPLLQAAMKPFDVAVAFWVMIRRPSIVMPSRHNVSKYEEVNCVPLSVVSVSAPRGCPRASARERLAPPLRAPGPDNDARAASPRSPACNSRSRTPSTPSPLRARPDLVMSVCQIWIRFCGFHATPLFLPSCAQTPRAHQQSTFAHHP